ncbi:MAG: protein translocase subunit SecD [Spirochaetes bacterium]|nr:protein translocase subunit SecD [Spirochaetota bacterium]
MSKNVKLVIVLLLFGITLWFLWPTLQWYSFTPKAEKEKTEYSIDTMISKGYTSEQVTQVLKLKRLRSQAVNLGLDLQGGMRVVLEADFDDYAKRLEKSVKEITPEEKSDGMARLLERLRGRIDKFGVSEVGIRRMDDARIIIELPGAKDPDRIMDVIKAKGKLDFMFVDEEATKAISTNDVWLGSFTNYAKVPAGCTNLYFYGKKDEFHRRVRGAPLILKTNIVLAGDMLKEARVGSGEFMEVTVDFELNAQGAEIFGEVTAANIGKQLAIVLDGNVMSAPNIRSEIPGGRGQISGGFDAQEAQDLATILREGALPLSIKIGQQEIVGESIGSDAVKAGVKALIIAIILIVSFMVLRYRISGVIASIAMVINVIMTIAVLAQLQFTLTLPGIAGIILTIGMAVDSNIIMFERIREELRKQQPISEAIHLGFDRAFWAILDSNMTTLISAMVLWSLGSGPVQGFAVTLFFGVLINLFTAVFLMRVIFDVILSMNLIKEKHWLFI